MIKYLTALDVGSDTIKAGIAEIKRDGHLSLLRLITAPSQGVRKGVVDDIADATRAINYVIDEIKQVAKPAVKNIYLGVGSADAKIQPSRGIIAVSRADYEIHQDDIDRVLQAAQAINPPPNRMVLHAITREFVVDGVGEIKNPLGMVGNRLEVQSLIIDAFAPAIKNLTKCVEIAGGSIAGLIFSPLAATRATVSKNQKELGVALIDVGLGKTGLSLYEENKLLHSGIFPVGSGNITNDLAVGLKTAPPAAEAIKRSYGSALAREVSQKDTIDLAVVDSGARGLIKKKFVAEIIEARLVEIFEFINSELKRLNKMAKLPGGVVLVGGGAKLPGVVDLARQELRMSAQIGVPDISFLEMSGDDLRDQIEDPEYACVTGLLMWGHDLSIQGAPAFKKMDPRDILKKILGTFLP